MADLDIGDLFDEHLPNLAHRLADMGVEPAGPPYARYHAWGPEQADIEFGIPVALPVPTRPLPDGVVRVAVALVALAAVGTLTAARR